LPLDPRENVIERTTGMLTLFVDCTVSFWAPDELSGHQVLERHQKPLDVLSI